MYILWNCSYTYINPHSYFFFLVAGHTTYATLSTKGWFVKIVDGWGGEKFYSSHFTYGCEFLFFFFVFFLLFFPLMLPSIICIHFFFFFFSLHYTISLSLSPLSLIGGGDISHHSPPTPSEQCWLDSKLRWWKEKTIIMESGGKNAGHELPCLRQLLFCSLVEGALMPTCVALWHGTWTWRKAVGGSLWLWQCCRQRKHWHLGRKWLCLFVSLPHSPFIFFLLSFTILQLFLSFFSIFFYVKN